VKDEARPVTHASPEKVALKFNRRALQFSMQRNRKMKQGLQLTRVFKTERRRHGDRPPSLKERLELLLALGSVEHFFVFLNEVGSSEIQ